MLAKQGIHPGGVGGYYLDGVLFGYHTVIDGARDKRIWPPVRTWTWMSRDNDVRDNEQFFHFVIKIVLI
jgi:hypothetical protein